MVIFIVESSLGPLEFNPMLWTIIALIVLMFFIGLAAWLVFLWAAKSGQFDDVERPKHRMMDEDS
jgi:cbb3-type cytochrome oxidase maturation protein